MNQDQIIKQSIDILLINGYSMGRGGVILPPSAQVLTIKKSLENVSEPKPSAETVRKACANGEIQAERRGETGRGRWEMRRASFDFWLSRWQERNQELLAFADDAEILTLSGWCDPSVMTFPDPRLCGLILLNKKLENNEFVQAFVNYHRDLNLRLFDDSTDLYSIVSRSRARKILWISLSEIPPEIYKYKTKIEEWIISEST